MLIFIDLFTFDVCTKNEFIQLHILQYDTEPVAAGRQLDVDSKSQYSTRSAMGLQSENQQHVE